MGLRRHKNYGRELQKKEEVRFRVIPIIPTETKYYISSKVIVLGTKLGKKWGGKNRTQPRDSLSRAGIEPSDFCKNMLLMGPAGRAARAQTGAENPSLGFVS